MGPKKKDPAGRCDARVSRTRNIDTALYHEIQKKNMRIGPTFNQAGAKETKRAGGCVIPVHDLPRTYTSGKRFSFVV